MPDFGRVVAQMQFDMYHHYTVDEHSIRAIGLLAAIERGELADDHPLSTALFRQIGSRRTLYVAVLLHDIAKGRGGDHSVLGEQVALQLCPRFGLDAAETETVAWLVRYHLLMSATAFKRDLADPKTIEDFAASVQSPERLRLLLILTVVDIRAVGPGTWNDWKRQLLRSLFDAAEERLRLGHKQRGRASGGQGAAGRARRRSGLARRRRPRPCPPPARQLLAGRTAGLAGRQCPPGRSGRSPFRRALSRASSRPTNRRPARRASASSHRTGPGLFYRICAGLAAAGASIVDARIHTTRDGMALDNLLVQDSQRRAYADRRLRARLVKAVEAALGADALPAAPAAPPLPRRRAAFKVAPSVIVAEHASTRTTVVEVNARDREGLLARLALAIHDEGLQVRSAHIATYGERAVDVFYLTRGDGAKLQSSDVAALREALIAAAGESESRSRAA